MNQTKYKVLGLMSGTSLDGLDLAFCTFHLAQKKWHYKIEAAHTIRYPKRLKIQLESLPNSSAQLYAKMHVDLGKIGRAHV